ncbi:MAG TPA: NAD(P)-binding domain-containing protein [Streptosporangiaceae bacterium]|nr:NAD(P)-binding domain-containing protein [Streptosporangiaceae bacterium]
MGRVCVIGAGSSGVAACMALHARSIAFDCFEAGSAVGGNWRYGNDNGMSSAYRSLHAVTSRNGMAYAALPMPDDYPDYPGHALVAKYLDDVVDYFGFRAMIQFKTDVCKVEQAAGGGWDVTVRQRDTGDTSVLHFSAVLVATGHHWHPRYPEPLPGGGRFRGEQLHSHGYRSPQSFEGKRVLVVGAGNSACDVAVDCSQVAARTLLAIRRGVHIMPKYLFGVPTDRLTLMRVGTRAPLWLQQMVVTSLVRVARGDLRRFGLPKPGHGLLSAPPTVSDSLLSRVGHGDIVVKPAIDRFEGGDLVRFTDGSTEPVDVVVYATGYEVSFPFFDPSLFSTRYDGVRLYHRVVPPDLPGLYFIGLVQPVGAVMPVAEAQSEWVADLLEGCAGLPSRAEMEREITRYRVVTTRRYPYCAHPIQVDFLAYQRELRRERRRQRLATHPAARQLAGGVDQVAPERDAEVGL